MSIKQLLWWVPGRNRYIKEIIDGGTEVRTILSVTEECVIDVVSALQHAYSSGMEDKTKEKSQ